MGVSPKGISGMLARAKRDGLIKKNGSGYELTAKGQKIEIGASANG
jgi:Mn-dependent DtxR family transcriptional regulator